MKGGRRRSEGGKRTHSEPRENSTFNGETCVARAATTQGSCAAPPRWGPEGESCCFLRLSLANPRTRKRVPDMRRREHAFH
jgi:hypothetical protein